MAYKRKSEIETTVSHDVIPLPDGWRELPEVMRSVDVEWPLGADGNFFWRKPAHSKPRLVRLPRGGRRVWCGCGASGVIFRSGPWWNSYGTNAPGAVAYDCGVCGAATRVEFVWPHPSDRHGVRWRRPLVWLRDETPKETAERRARKNQVVAPTMWEWIEHTPDERFGYVALPSEC